MNSIWIENNEINYKSEFCTLHKDKSWSLDLNKVKVIGIINRMDGDDDSFFIVFISNDLQKYFLNLTWEIKGIKLFKEFIELKFRIGLSDWDNKLCDNEKIIYPKSLNGKQLYQSSLKNKIKTIFAIDHAANGELSEYVINYIGNKKTLTNFV